MRPLIASCARPAWTARLTAPFGNAVRALAALTVVTPPTTPENDTTKSAATSDNPGGRFGGGLDGPLRR